MPQTASILKIFVLIAKRCCKRKISWLALVYAGYIGLGVSMTIHWCSDSVAGAILGTVIGRVVGKSWAQGQQG